MSILGKWRIVEMPDYTDDYPNMMGPAYIRFEPTRGEFALGCVTGAFAGGGAHDAVEFNWDGNDEMEQACGAGWAALQPDGSLIGEIHFLGGDEISFIARPWTTSSTAC
jgi:hypothetical protein